MTSSGANRAAILRGADSQARPARDRFSDIAVARRVAEAVRSMPSVVGLSPGLGVLVATYGPRERVTGVMVLHPSPRDTVIEVHVALHASLDAEEAVGDMSVAPALVDSGGDTVLTSAAGAIREAVYRAVETLGIAPPARVDVVIDDIQFSA